MEQFLGEIRQVSFTYAPQGWLMCDGSLQSIAQNGALYTLLGTTYGGDGVSTFGLPDLRGRCPLGQGTGSGGTYLRGALGGAEQVTLNTLQLPVHNHAIKASSASSFSTPANHTLGKSIGQYQPLVSGTPSGMMLALTGGNQPHENRMPFLVLNYIIATVGVYPSQS